MPANSASDSGCGLTCRSSEGMLVAATVSSCEDPINCKVSRETCANPVVTRSARTAVVNASCREYRVRMSNNFFRRFLFGWGQLSFPWNRIVSWEMAQDY